MVRLRSTSWRFLYKGPKFAAASAESPERKANHEQHIAYIDRMTKEGKLVIYGPILDGGDLRGMYVFKAASIEEARSWADQEPSAQIGRIDMRVYPWLGRRTWPGDQNRFRRPMNVDEAQAWAPA